MMKKWTGGIFMTKPKVIQIHYGEEMPRESAILFYRLIERLIIQSLPNDPHLTGLFLQDSLEELSSQKEEI